MRAVQGQGASLTSREPKPTRSDALEWIVVSGVLLIVAGLITGAISMAGVNAWWR